MTTADEERDQARKALLVGLSQYHALHINLRINREHITDPSMIPSAEMCDDFLCRILRAGLGGPGKP